MLSPFAIHSDLTTPTNRKLLDVVRRVWQARGTQTDRTVMRRDDLQQFYQLVMNPAHQLPCIVRLGGQPYSWFGPGLWS